MMLPSTLYDEYIDRPKLTEQKKTPVEYIVPPPSRGVGTKMLKIQDCEHFLRKGMYGTGMAGI